MEANSTILIGWLPGRYLWPSIESSNPMLRYIVLVFLFVAAGEWLIVKGVFTILTLGGIRALKKLPSKTQT